MGVSVYCSLSVLCLFVCVLVRVISNQSTRKKTHYVSDFSKLDAFSHKTHITVSIISLGKIAHQMWRDHPFTQRSKTKGRTVGWGLEVTGKGRGVGQNFGGLHKIGRGLEPFWQL